MAELKFNMKKLTARGMSDFLRASKENDLQAMATVFAQCAESVPEAWKIDPKNAEEWLELPYFGEFRVAMGAFMEEAANAVKK